jgi:8-amino-7-oxononanoate synthase
MAAVVRAALKLSAAAEPQRERLRLLVAHAGKLMARHPGWKASGTQIQPIILGADARALRFAEDLQALGHDIRAIRPPTVPEGTARLRLAITTHAKESDLDAVFGHLAASLAKA